MNPIDLDKDTIQLIADLMDDEQFETYLFYYDESMDAEIIHLMKQWDKQLTKG